MIEWAETALNVRRKLSQWTVQHGGMIGVFALGAAMGAVLGLEAFDIKLTQGSGEIVGAAIGAGLAIGLGAWLSHSRERRQSEVVERVLMEIFDPLVEAMGALRSYAPSMSSPRVSDIEHYEMLARNISARAVSAETQILALKSAMDAMGLVGASLFFKLRSSAKIAEGVAQEIMIRGTKSREISDSEGHRFMIDASHWRYEFNLAAKLMRQLA